MNEGSFIKNKKWFLDVIKNKDKCVKDANDALSREFFRGVYRFRVESDPGSIYEVCPPALTIKTIRDRLKDERFCNACFYFERHDWNCERSPWNLKKIY